MRLKDNEHSDENSDEIRARKNLDYRVRSLLRFKISDDTATVKVDTLWFKLLLGWLWPWTTPRRPAMPSSPAISSETWSYSWPDGGWLSALSLVRSPGLWPASRWKIREGSATSMYRTWLSAKRRWAPLSKHFLVPLCSYWCSLSSTSSLSSTLTTKISTRRTVPAIISKTKQPE